MYKFESCNLKFSRMSHCAINFNKKLIYGVSPYVKPFETRDTFLHICEFLYAADIMIFSSICKDYLRDFYQPAWDIIHRRHFPISIDRPLTHIASRIALSLAFFYNYIDDDRMRFEWSLIANCETQMSNCQRFIELVGDSSIRAISYKERFIEYKTDRDHIISSKTTLVKFLEAFQFNSEIDMDGHRYYTIKFDIDTLDYGIDPIKDPERSYIKTQWLTGRYHDRIEYYYNPADAGNGDFTYGIDSYGTLFRQRIRPSYC